jgi:acyl-coenzyme A thioesterase PaaI-like protein
MDEPQQPAELDPRHLEALRERIAESPFHRWAGIELVRVGYGEGEVLDAQEKLLARASATFIVLPAPGAF